jgi:hypothetical protein
MKRKWQVWYGDDIENVVFTGSRSACLRFYKQHGGDKKDYHFGYELIYK